MQRHRVVIIGAGTAGCVLAGRLSENADLHVVLIEEGSAPVGTTDGRHAGRPLWSLHRMLDPTRSRRWRQTDRSGSTGTDLVTGTGPGGSAAINGGYFIRPTAVDLETWSTAVGDPGWGERLVAAMIRSETDIDHPDDPLHGDDGPIPVERDRDRLHPASLAFLRATSDLDTTDHPDMNDGGSYGIGPIPFNASSGSLVDPATAYLYPVLDRPNLDFIAATRVERVAVTGSRVVSVEVTDRSLHHSIEVDDVIVCAGTIGSARILFASGIGDADLLRHAGIRPVSDLGCVGRRFRNHPCVDLLYEPDRAVLAEAGPQDGFMQLVAHPDPGSTGGRVVELMATRRPYGVITGGDGRDTMLSLRVTLMDQEDSGAIRPTADGVQITAAPGADGPDGSPFGALPGPVIDIAMGIMRSAAFRSLMAGTMSSTTSPCPHPVPGTAFHMTGSCPMGTDPDSGVVDTSFRVHGVEGLHVVDASVVPTPLSRGPAACVVGLAELAAELFVGTPQTSAGSDRGIDHSECHTPLS